MKIKNLTMKNYTVFKQSSIEFDNGINIFIGENGTGKTHIIKLLYSACQAANSKVSFPHKIVRTMMPDDYKIQRLASRSSGTAGSSVSVAALSEKANSKRTLTAEFNGKTKKWDACVKGEENWEKEFKDVSSIFIPAKEILSNSFNLTGAVEKNNVKFDDTYVDIINSAKVDISKDKDPQILEKQLAGIEQIIEGKVYYDTQRDEFYLKKGRAVQEFDLVAEGIRKMALLWQLIRNGALENGSVLFWDEPEANINPKYISVIVELLLELQRGGVQIFISTHDYMLAKYFEVRKSKENSVLFHSLEHSGDGIEISSEREFGELKNNVIITSFEALLDEIYSEEAKQ